MRGREQLMKDLDRLRSELMAAIADTADVVALEKLRVLALGKKGHITSMMRDLGALVAHDSIIEEDVISSSK